MRRWISRVWAKAGPKCKAIAGAALGLVFPLVVSGITQGFDWKAILAGVVTGVGVGLGVYHAPNRPAAD